MGKIFNTLRYGRRKVKIFLILVMAIFVVGGICAVAGLLLDMLPLLFVGVAAIAVSGIAFFSKRFRETEREAPSKKIKPEPVFHDRGSKKEVAEETVSERYSYDEDEIKRLLKKYKVKCEHIPVVIDLCQSERIRQCPAYMWFDKRYIGFLLLENPPRMISYPCERTPLLTYEKGVTASPKSDYEEIRENNILNTVFGELLPTYHEDELNGRRVYKKNLYVLEPDIKLTNRSVRGVLRILNCDFRVRPNEKVEDIRENFVEEAFKSMILWKDNIYTTQEYKVRLKAILAKMSESDISYNEFKSNVDAMVRMRIITSEYAEEYTAYAFKNK